MPTSLSEKIRSSKIEYLASRGTFFGIFLQQIFLASIMDFTQAALGGKNIVLGHGHIGRVIYVNKCCEVILHMSI